MLSITAGLAEGIGCKYLLISNPAGDRAIYPDCRENFIQAMNEAISSGTYTNTEILALFTNMTKREIAL